MLQIGGGKVTNFEGAGYGSATLRQATRSSINTVFAQLADRLGPARLVDQARAFGMDKPVPFELAVQASLMPAPERMTKWETAWAGVGQPVGAGIVKGPVVTALQMALVAGGIANKGVVMKPYLVDHTADPSGRPIVTTSPQAWTTATDPATASTVRDLMVDVVKNGSGSAGEHQRREHRRQDRHRGGRQGDRAERVVHRLRSRADADVWRWRS